MGTMSRLDPIRAAAGFVRPATAVLAFAVSSSPSLNAQRPTVPLATRWPPRIAVGMRQGDQLSPLTVEARRDGWVIVTILSTRPDEGLPSPTMRLIAQARDVRTWTSRVRAFLQTAQDSANKQRVLEGPSLGDGGFRIAISAFRTNNSSVLFSVYGCGSGSGTSQPAPAELTNLLALLDSAAKRAGGGVGRPPTLKRPYYASEVSCPVSPAAGNVPPEYPERIQPDRRRRVEIGAGFVVDTSGRVERGSVAFLPGTDPDFANAAQRAIVDWRFRRADWGGAPVRQVAHTKIVFSPTAPTADTGYHRISVEGDSDGWVHFIHGAPSEKGRAPVQEWFDPDSVDAWASRVDSLNAEAAALDTNTPRLLEASAGLGWPSGIGYSAGFFAHGKAVEFRAGLRGCAGAFTEGENPVDAARLERFRAAARAARAFRTPPADQASVVHDADDTACPAWLPWYRSPRHDFTRVWQYPTGVYPKSMAASNARADVFASFVVDTGGKPLVATLRVLPGSDPRAVAAMPATLGALRFRPATRGGRAVPQLVIQTIVFEPPPACPTPDVSPACGRRYSPDLDANRRTPSRR
jgi:hypothetical protein